MRRAEKRTGVMTHTHTHFSSVLIINSSFWQSTIDFCCPTDTCEIALQQRPVCVWFYYKFVLRKMKFCITLYYAVKDVSKCCLCVCACSPQRVWTVCAKWRRFCSRAWVAEWCFCCSSTLESNVQTWSNLQDTFNMFNEKHYTTEFNSHAMCSYRNTHYMCLSVQFSSVVQCSY